MRNPILKLNGIVEDSLKKYKNGKEFFYHIDSEIRKSENEDIVLNLFQKIYNKYGYSYNLVISGSFSDYILYLLKKSRIVCHGTILQLSGSITSHNGEIGKITPDKEIIIQYKNEEYSNRDFIFVDDSYFSGTTEFKINEFLNKVNSSIIKTYIVYDGGLKNKDKISLYRYFDHHKGSLDSVKILLNYLYKVKDIPHTDFENRIIKGEIKTILDLKNKINDFYTKIGRDRMNVFKRNEVKSWKMFLESVNDKLDVSYLKNVFSELGDEFDLRCVQSNVLEEAKYVIPEYDNEYRGAIDSGIDFRKEESVGKFCTLVSNSRLSNNPTNLKTKILPHHYSQTNFKTKILLTKKETLFLKYHESYGFSGDKKSPPSKEEKEEILEYVNSMKEYLEGDGYLVECRCSMNANNRSIGDGVERFQIFIFIVIQKA